MKDEKSLGDILPKKIEDIVPTNQQIRVKYGAFSYTGDIKHLDSTISIVMKLSETVDLSEPEDVGKIYD